MDQLREWFRRSFSHDFFLLALILFLINLPFWDNGVPVFHDTVANFEGFYFFYNEFFHHHEIARWVPYGLYGVPSDIFQIGLVSPAGYLFGLLGGLLKIKNAFLLFKISIFFEQLVLLLGTYRLSRLLFQHKSAAFFVSLGVIASTVWFVQVEFNFRIYYLLPLALYFFISFFLTGKARWLGFSGAVFAVSFLGTPAYYAALYLWIVSLMGAVLCFYYPGAWRGLWTDRGGLLISLALFAAIAVPAVYFVTHSLDGILYYAQGRDPVTRMTTLQAFLEYGGNIGLWKILGLIYAGPVDADNTHYIGLLPLLFFCYAVLNVRHPVFAAIGLVLASLACLSLADTTFVARAVYEWFPMMKTYRHIGLIAGIARLLLILAAGFGLDHFLTAVKTANKTGREDGPHKRAIRYAGGAILALMLFVDLKFNFSGALYPRVWPEFFYFGWLGLAAAAFLLGGYAKISVRAGGIIAVVCLAFDLLSYQNLAFAVIPKSPPGDLEIFNVHPYEFQDRRTDNLRMTPRVKAAAEFVQMATGISPRPYSIAYSFVQLDPCAPQFRTDLLPERFDRLIRARDGIPLKRLPKDRAFLDVIGCTDSKLRLISNVQFAETSEQAEEMVRQAPRINEIAVLEGVRPEAVSQEAAESEGSVSVVSFKANELVVETEANRAGGAWLVYADSFHPGWRAFVDSKPAPLAAANLAFKAVHVPEGRHTVRFAFFGASDWVGVFIAGIGVLFSLAMAAALVCLVSGKSPTLPDKVNAGKNPQEVI